MICVDCGYLHAPHTVEDIQTEGFMYKFIQHQKYVKRLGEKTLSNCKEFDTLHKQRIKLEKYNFKHNGLTPARQEEWNDLEIQYIKATDDRTNSIQIFIDMCNHEKIDIPEWVKENKWLTVEVDRS